MRALGRSSFWAAVAAIAGVAGAAAAVYQLLQTDQRAAHLTFPHYLDRPPYSVRVVAFSDPIVLTGRWYIRHGPWWYPKTLQDGATVEARDSRISRNALPLKDIRVAANESGYIAIGDDEIEAWVGRAISACKTGEFEIGIEYEWKGGSSWARTTLPLCVR